MAQSQVPSNEPPSKGKTIMTDLTQDWCLVPISSKSELAAELKAARRDIETLQADNKKVNDENAALRKARASQECAHAKTLKSRLEMDILLKEKVEALDHANQTNAVLQADSKKKDLDIAGLGTANRALTLKYDEALAVMLKVFTAFNSLTEQVIARHQKSATVAEEAMPPLDLLVTADDDIASLQERLLKDRIKRVAQRSDKQKEEHTQKEEAWVEEKKDLQAQLAAAQKELTQLKAESGETFYLKAELRTTQEELDSLEAELRIAQEELEDLKTDEKGDLKTQLHSAQDKIAELQAVTKEDLSDIQRLQKENENMETEVSDLKRTIRNLMAKHPLPTYSPYRDHNPGSGVRAKTGLMQYINPYVTVSNELSPCYKQPYSEPRPKPRSEMTSNDLIEEARAATAESKKQ